MLACCWDSELYPTSWMTRYVSTSYLVYFSCTTEGGTLIGFCNYSVATIAVCRLSEDESLLSYVISCFRTTSVPK